MAAKPGSSERPDRIVAEARRNAQQREQALRIHLAARLRRVTTLRSRRLALHPLRPLRDQPQYVSRP